MWSTWQAMAWEQFSPVLTDSFFWDQTQKKYLISEISCTQMNDLDNAPKCW